MLVSQSRVKACTECRQQKQRCDWYKDYSQPCSRCARLQIECKFSPSFKRRKKRTKADLQNELDELKQKSQPVADSVQSNEEYTSVEVHSAHDLDSFQDVSTVTASSSNTIPALDDARHGTNSLGTAPWTYRSPADSDSQRPIIAPSLHFGNVSTEAFNPVDHFVNNGTSALGEVDPRLSSSLGSSPSDNYAHSRTLAIATIDGKKITECFVLFHQHYSPLLPDIFDSRITPDEMYSLSPLLFWSIVCTGARKYSSDPTVLEKLAKPVIELALLSMIHTMQSVLAIQGALILCSWPMPMSTLYKDPSHALAGAAMQLALQNGLHAFCHEHEFARRPTRRQRAVSASSPSYLQAHVPDLDVAFRTRLWTHCLIVFQSTSLCDGLPFSAIAHPATPERHVELYSSLSPSLSARYRVHCVLTDAVIAIRRDISLEDAEIGPSLNSLIQIFDLQLENISLIGLDDMTQLYHASARMCVRAFHFFLPRHNVDEVGFFQLYSVACETIKLTSQLDSSRDFASHMSHHSARMVALAAYCVLRICRSHLNQRLDLREAEKHFFTAIAVSKKRSARNNDLDALNSIMLTQLWSNNNLFCRPNDNTDSLKIDVRRRLFMSVVFDSFWWWLREFGELSPNHRSAQQQNYGSRNTLFGDRQGENFSPGSNMSVAAAAASATQESLPRVLMDDAFLPSDPSFDSFDYTDLDWATVMASLVNTTNPTVPTMAANQRRD